MLKLLKFEIVKSRLWLILTAAIVGVVELIFLLGCWLSNDTMSSIGFLLLVSCGFFGIIGLLIFGIWLFATDITKKHGYMLFLTPCSAYQIIGSKLLVALMALIVGFICYSGIWLLNLGLIQNGEGGILSAILSELPREYLLPILAVAVQTLVQWFLMMITIYLAIALTYTYFSTLRCKGLLAAAVYLGLNWALGFLTLLITGPKMMRMLGLEYARLSFLEVMDLFGYYAILASVGIDLLLGVGFFLLTSLLVKKKLSL